MKKNKAIIIAEQSAKDAGDLDKEKNLTTTIKNNYNVKEAFLASEPIDLVTRGNLYNEGINFIWKTTDLDYKFDKYVNHLIGLYTYDNIICSTKAVGHMFHFFMAHRLPDDNKYNEFDYMYDELMKHLNNRQNKGKTDFNYERSIEFLKNIPFEYSDNSENGKISIPYPFDTFLKLLSEGDERSNYKIGNNFPDSGFNEFEYDPDVPLDKQRKFILEQLIKKDYIKPIKKDSANKERKGDTNE